MEMINFEQYALPENFGETYEAINALAEKCRVITIKDSETLKEAKAAISDIVKRRGAVEARRKELKQPVLKVSTAIDTEAKKITEMLYNIENDLKRKKVDYEYELGREEREREEKEAARVAEIRAKINSIKQFGNFAGWSDLEELTKSRRRFEDAMAVDDFNYQEFVGEADAARKEVARLFLEAITKAEEREEKERKLQIELAEAKAKLAAAEAKKADDFVELGTNNDVVLPETVICPEVFPESSPEFKVTNKPKLLEDVPDLFFLDVGFGPILREILEYRFIKRAWEWTDKEDEMVALLKSDGFKAIVSQLTGEKA